MLKNSISRLFGKVGFAFKKHSPELLLVAGIASGVAGAVMACKSTLKVEEIIKEKNENLDKIKQVKNDEKLSKHYSKEDERKDIFSIYAKTGYKMVKLYAPAIALGVLSLTCILASHNILKDRNVALASAYAGLSSSFKDYRKRVESLLGKEQELSLRHNITEHEVINDETGKVEHRKEIDKKHLYSDYARYFDETNPNWNTHVDYVHMFLKAQQAYANDKLKAKGYLFLNDVYDLLGLSRTKAGQVVGWKYDKKNPSGDNYIDFGIYTNNCFLNSGNGVSQAVILDFNVDGNIWETEIDY